jgi:hypothetical protein
MWTEAEEFDASSVKMGLPIMLKLILVLHCLENSVYQSDILNFDQGLIPCSLL